MEQRMGRGISFTSLLGESGKRRKISNGARGRVLAENKFGAFSASQNTSGQVLVE